MRHLISTRELSRNRIDRLISHALAIKHQDGRRPFPSLHGKTVLLWFNEPSTRTLFSFSQASRKTGAWVEVLNESSSSLTKGESLKNTLDTLRLVGVSAVVVRSPERGLPEKLAEADILPVINAGDGSGEHPTQCLLDLMTISEERSLDGFRLLICGDVRHSRVARSHLLSAGHTGCSITLCGPARLLPDPDEFPGIQMTDDFNAVLKACDGVMMLRTQDERHDFGATEKPADFRKKFALTVERLSILPESALILHPGPFREGVEIDAGVVDDPRCRIQIQVKNGVFLRMAVLLDILSDELPGDGRERIDHER